MSIKTDFWDFFGESKDMSPAGCFTDIYIKERGQSLFKLYTDLLIGPRWSEVL